jgi:hypothetical protein
MIAAACRWFASPGLGLLWLTALAAAPVDFERDVQALLGRAGCNTGSCHGSFQGKGGFYLSLFGYAADKDYIAITRDGLGRRINPQDPDRSLLLLKATGQESHGGGQRLAKDSPAYQKLRQWIAQGARWTPGSGTVQALEVSPRQLHFAAAGESVPLRVVARFADGTSADITDLCEYRVNDDFIAEVSPAGLVTGQRPGDTAVIVAYRGYVATMRALVPARPADVPASPVVERNFIDTLVQRKLRELNLVSSPEASDEEFLRRVTIDTIASLPTPDEVRAFLADQDPLKREKKIDELLRHPRHAAVWAIKLSDITGNNVDTLEPPVQVRPRRGRMWYEWLRARLERNEPYDRIVRGILTATSREGLPVEDWLQQTLSHEAALETGKPSRYADRDTLDLFWRRQNFTVEQYAELTAAAFLGVRIECAQCHKHPFDRWTQADYRAYANSFSSVRFALSPATRPLADKINKDRRDAADAKNRNRLFQIREVFTDRGGRRLTHPDTNAPLPPKALGGPELRGDDPRVALADWVTHPDNPFFARAMANRVWAHYLGVGIVHPVDNFSVGNPPSNPELLDALAADFAAHGFDLRRLERLVLASRTYQTSSTPYAGNHVDKNNFARAYPRRLMAEAMVDVLNDALGTRENFGEDAPSGRAIDLASNRVANGNLAYIFRIFGRPTRTTSCDCERDPEPALPQTLFLMTDQVVMRKITDGRLRTLLAQKRSNEQILEECYLAALSRMPTAQERERVLGHVAAQRDRLGAWSDVMWALINTREFILNH